MHQRFLLLGLLVLHTPAGAQCTKDTDCKGDRICEQRVCVSPSRGSPALVAPQIISPSGASSAPPSLQARLEQSLLCQRDPNPVAALAALKKGGLIESAPREVSDGAPVHRANAPLTVFGFPVTEVSGFDPKSVKPENRFPGTLSPLFLSVVVSGELATVKAELERRSSGKAVVSKGSADTKQRPTTEIACFGK